MKSLSIVAVAIALTVFASCGFRPTKVRVRVVEHHQAVIGKHYALLYEVLEPKNLAGRYGVAATQRSDLVTNIDGGELDVNLNSTAIGALGNRPGGYEVSAPGSRQEDFLEMAKRLK